jgi:hypothetical protein
MAGFPESAIMDGMQDLAPRVPPGTIITLNFRQNMAGPAIFSLFSGTAGTFTTVINA